MAAPAPCWRRRRSSGLPPRASIRCSLARRLAAVALTHADVLTADAYLWRGSPRRLQEPPSLMPAQGGRAMMSNSLPGLDFGLGSEIDMLRETVRNFAQAKIAPLAAEIDRANSFPRALWPQLGALGLLGITVEQEL